MLSRLQTMSLLCGPKVSQSHLKCSKIQLFSFAKSKSFCFCTMTKLPSQRQCTYNVRGNFSLNNSGTRTTVLIRYSSHFNRVRMPLNINPIIIGIPVVFLVVLVTIRLVQTVQLRQQGYSKVSLPAYGSRTQIYKYKDTLLFNGVVTTVKDVETFQVRPDDIWVVSFPRSGTTWIQEIIYLIQTGLDIEAAKSRTLDDRFPFLEFDYPGVREVENMESPRLIKSHLPFHLLPASLRDVKPKVVYIARNPRDVIVSYHHFARMLLPLRFTGEFQQFADLFLKDQVPYAPWWKHVLQFWERRDDDNILFVTYEQLQKNPRETIATIAEFLGKSITDEQKTTIMNHCSFESMKTNESVNHEWFDTLGLRRKEEAQFMRSGKIGEWQQHFTGPLNVRVEQMLKARLKDSGLYFDYFPSD